MSSKLEEILKDKEKRARLLFWVWVLSLLITVLGYLIILYTFLK